MIESRRRSRLPAEAFQSLRIAGQILGQKFQCNKAVREERWVIADLTGKGKHIRTVPVPVWAKRAVDRHQQWHDLPASKSVGKDLGR
jgi:hypothetical protein